MSFFNKMRTQKLLSFTLILFTLSIGIVIGTLISTGVKAAKDDRTVAPGASQLVIPNPVELSNQFTEIAKQVEPSVVNISTTYSPKPTTRTRNNGGRRQLMPPDDEDQGDSGGIGGMDDLLNRFFGNGMPEMQHKGYALGSGVVVDKAGYILTNHHVVDKADRIQVKFAGDATDYDAKVVGFDSQTDLAVIRVEGKHDLKPAKVGNSDAVQVGDWCVAIGSPFGFEATVTAGIISAKERDVDPTQQFQHFLQTDAAINPGNSGGPLLNIRGEVVGINTAIASRSGGYQGIGFAMPINTAVSVYNEIIKNGHVTRGSIGIRFKEYVNNESLLKVYGAEHGGVFVDSVEPNQPADKAGMKPQDVVVSIGGKPIVKGQDLIDIVAETPVGNTLKVGIIRDKKPMTLEVVVGDRTKIFAQEYGGVAPNEPDTQGNVSQLKFGMSVQDLRPADRTNLGYKGPGGVLIASTEPGSFGDDIGLQKGDIIVELNREKVNSREDIRRIQATLKPGQPVAFQVMRQTQGPRGGGEWQSFFAAGTVPNQ